MYESAIAIIKSVKNRQNKNISLLSEKSDQSLGEQLLFVTVNTARH